MTKKIKKLEKEIYEKENVIRNICSKFEECNEIIDTLERKLKVAEDDKKYIEAKFVAIKKEIQKSTANFSCENCDLTFNSKSKLNEHTQEKHTNTENIILNESSTVSESEKTDSTLTKPDVCNYKSSSQNGMKIHKTKKHIH